MTFPRDGDERVIADIRGDRVVNLADTILAELLVAGIVSPARADDARVLMFTKIADDLYGNNPITIPRLRRDIR